MILPILLSFLLGTSSPTYNQTVYTSPVVMQDISVGREYIQNTLVPFYADYYSISETALYETIQCESAFVPSVRGDHLHSRGLAQISDIWHPEVSDEDAFNPFFAVDYLAKSIANGRGHEWTCYRNYQKTLAYTHDLN